MDEKKMDLIINQVYGKFSWDELKGTDFIHKNKVMVVVSEAIDFAFSEAKKEVFDDIEKNALSVASERYVEHGIWVRESTYNEIKKRHLSTFAEGKKERKAVNS